MTASKPTICSVHEGEPTKFFCVDDNVCVCSVCAVKSHRTCSDVILLAEAVVVKKATASRLALENKKIQEVLEDFNKKAKTAKSTLDSRKAQLGMDLKLLRQQINKKLDTLEDEAWKEWDSLTKPGLRQIEEKFKKTQNYLAKLREVNYSIKRDPVKNQEEYLKGVVNAEKVQSEISKVDLTLDFKCIDVKGEILEDFPSKIELKNVYKLKHGHVDEDGRALDSKSSTKSKQDLASDDADELMLAAHQNSFTPYHFIDWEHRFTGLVVLPNKRIVLVDHFQDGLFLLREDGYILCSMILSEKGPYDVCSCSDTKIAISFTGSVSIVAVYEVEGDKLLLFNKLMVGTHYGWGMDFFKDSFYIAAYERIYVVPEKEQAYFNLPGYDFFNSNICLNINGTKIFMDVMDRRQERVSERIIQCWHFANPKQPNLQWFYSRKEFVPSKIRYHRGHVFVADKGSGRIIQITENGKYVRDILLHGITSPESFCFVPAEDKLICTQWAQGMDIDETRKIHVLKLDMASLFQ